jgi:heptosyltransferase III
VATRLGIPVRWCAGPEETLDDAVRFENLYELGCWLASARLYVGNDSGITHLAAAVGTPVVAIFGPSDPAIWAPRGERVSVVSGKLEEITVDEVMEAAGLSGRHPA